MHRASELVPHASILAILVGCGSYARLGETEVTHGGRCWE